jgi:hypothetical protein
MTKDLGVWTADDCALVLIDYQNEMSEVIRSETSADLVELHGASTPDTVLVFAIVVGLAVSGSGWALLGHRRTATPPRSEREATVRLPPSRRDAG